jgi:hypothetical protein
VPWDHGIPRAALCQNASGTITTYPNLQEVAPITTKELADWYSGAAQKRQEQIETEKEERESAFLKAVEELPHYEPTPEEIAGEIPNRRRFHQAEFANTLGIARRVWRGGSQLVEREEFRTISVSLHGGNG